MSDRVWFIFGATSASMLNCDKNYTKHRLELLVFWPQATDHLARILYPSAASTNFLNKLRVDS